MSKFIKHIVGEFDHETMSQSCIICGETICAAKDILRIARDQVAEKHGYGDWLQIDMTDNEEHEKQEIKLSLSDEVALRFGDLIADKAWEAAWTRFRQEEYGRVPTTAPDKSTFMKELFPDADIKDPSASG